MRPTQLTLVCLLLGAFACGGDDGDTGAGSGDSGADSSGSTMGFPSTSEDDSTDDTLTTVSATEESTSSADSTTADPDTSSGATETGNENLCTPDGDDNECYVCSKEMCCDEFMACVEADPNCPCVLECLSMLDQPGPTEASMCSDQCDADFVTLTPSFMMITQCHLDNCANECGG